MAVGLLHALGVGLPQQGDEVGDVGVDVAVGQQAQKVHGLAGNRVGHQVLPGAGGVQRAVFDGLSHQLGALRVDLAAAQGIVAHLRVAHIVVAGQANGGAVGLQISMRAGAEKTVQSGGVGDLHRVAAAAVALADAVHNDQNNGFFHMCTSQKRVLRVFLHFTGHIILHHFLQTYNHFFIFSVTNKNTSGKAKK